MPSFSSNSNAVFPIREGVMKEIFVFIYILIFSSDKKTKFLAVEESKLCICFQMPQILMEISSWRSDMPDMCSTCRAFKFLGSTHCQPVLEAKINEKTGSLKVVLKVVTVAEGNREH